ncbi:MAG: protein kinase [Myxococcales bacterium]|nr:protein kinase [Myxococcales bacterium]
MSAAAVEREIGSVVAGKYRLLRILGRGGMGVVYEAEHAMTRRRVAVKVLHAHHRQTGDAAKRFINEAQAAGRIQHPNVVEVLDAGEDSDQSLYLVLELLQGHDLATLLMRQRRIDVADTITIIAQVLQALAVAHAQGIIHRDIKPENIFLTRSVTGEQHVKILDFGISKAINPGDGQALNVTQTNTTVGTPHYMSPEQARGERNLDARADLWAGGVVLYECLAGRVPFDGDSYNDQIVKVITEPHPSLSQFDVPLELSRIVDRALEKDRTKRYANASEMLADIRQFIERHREYATVPLQVLKAPQHLPEAPTPAPAPPKDPAFEFGGDTVRTPAAASLYDTSSEDVPTTVRPIDQQQQGGKLLPLAGAGRAERRPTSPKGPAALFTGPNRIRNSAIAVGLVFFAVLVGALAAYAVSRTTPTQNDGASATVTFHFVGLPANARLVVGGVPIYGSNTAFVPRGTSAVSVEISAPGFAPMQFPLVPNDNHTVPVNLQPATPPGAQQTPDAQPTNVVPAVVSDSGVAAMPPPQQAVVAPTVVERPTPAAQTQDNEPTQGAAPRPRTQDSSGASPSTGRTRNTTRASGTSGVLMISSTSNCTVSVDGRRAGSAPLRLVLEPGEHVVRCLTPPARIRTQNVSVTTGQISTVTFD